MDKHIVSQKYNSKWHDVKYPMFTIVTSVHNRKELLKRSLNSVRLQTCKDFEHIIIDNASDENLDDLVENFMSKVDYPMAYIKRNYGPGPHTGWNTGFFFARGRYLTIVDSDDEIMPNSIQVFLDAWKSIPQKEYDSFNEIVALCKLEDGEINGNQFPPNINKVSRKKNIELMKQAGMEHFVCYKVSLLKEHYFPEPEFVRHVSENNLWDIFHKKYKCFCINEALRLYYVNSPGSVNFSSNLSRKMTFQNFIDILWACKYRMENQELYEDSFIRKLMNVMKINICVISLKKLSKYPHAEWATSNPFNFKYRMFSLLLWVPCSVLAWLCSKEKYRFT
ncbi:glycosyltransferase family 2 protein [Bacteroides caccae]|jgi:glycosyltransferase involved in cell wall biosynthesis|uniref:glycosyltransferase family 2 protein n=1 Tax=Bacteroides caccae TaxID=47678 RepID=UPI00321A78CF